MLFSYLILYGLITFLNFFLQSIDIFLQGLDNTLKFALLTMETLYLSLVIINFLLKTCELKLQTEITQLIHYSIFITKD